MIGFEKCYWNIYIVGIILACFFLMLSCMLFFKLHIPKVIGILTGITRKMALKKMRGKKCNPSLATSYRDYSQRGSIDAEDFNTETKGETRLLHELNMKQKTARIGSAEDGDFMIEKNITLIHTLEIIY